jgi:hypothetical protein
MTAKLPGARADLIPGKGPMAQEFYRYFLELGRQQSGSANAADVSALVAQLNALAAEVDALPHGTGFPTLRVNAPLTSAGLLQNGFALLGWNGTTDDVPEGDDNLYFTNARADARIAAHATFPFFDSDGDAANIPLTSDAKLPFFGSDGTESDIALAA